ncbi:MAG: exodeoxyribonuclease VII large subunit [Gammaproteobacteria bacterium]
MKKPALELNVTDTIYTVSKLNQQIRELLEQHFADLWIEGEISNFKRAPSGHWYFSLKDSHAQVRCALFRAQNNGLGFIPRDGMQVLIYARVSLYAERGDYQLIVEHLEEAGDGLLRRAFEVLKTRLAEEGLFDATHKKPLPKFPRCIGVITSAGGAAIHDILTVLQRRAAHIPIIIYPTLVQGTEAKAQIVHALTLANQRQECDVLILARGGGSLEDLWPFNEEIVARAIFNSEITIVTGIGHEIDFTIADFVADQRAPTPSAAAELVSPNHAQWQQQIVSWQKRLTQGIQNEWRHHCTLLENLQKRLRHPVHYWQEQTQRLDYYQRNLVRAQLHLLQQKNLELQHLNTALKRYTPNQRLQELYGLQNSLQRRLQNSMQHLLQQKSASLQHFSHALDAISPLNTLKRGYAIISHQQHIISDVQQLKIGEKVTARLSKGELLCVVEKIL